jgi:uncharacterized damage-inducible protein DinB
MLLQGLLQYNYWANEQVLYQLEQLTPEQLHAPGEMSHGTPFDLVRHILDTEWSWRMFASGGNGTRYLWEVEDLSGLAAIWRLLPQERSRWLEFLSAQSEAGLDSEVDYGSAQGGNPNVARVWQILAHVVTHSTHHRSELCRYLHDCGHPLNDIDFLTYVARKTR